MKPHSKHPLWCKAAVQAEAELFEKVMKLLFLQASSPRKNIYMQPIIKQQIHLEGNIMLTD